MKSIPCTGYTNAAKCAEAYLRACGAELDEKSFRDVAEKIGDWPHANEQGFFVSTAEDLARLCRVGGFVICMVNGIVTCKLPEQVEVLQ